MKEEINEIFFNEKENNVEKRKTFNQSIELLQTEDIFIDQKEEIKRIKKKRLEIKNYNQNKTNFINMKYIKNRRKKFNTLNNLNLTEDIKNKNKGNLQDIDKKAKKLNKNDKNIKTLKLKFFPDNSNNINENKENIKSENEINGNNDIKSNINSNNNDEENTILNNDNDIMLSTEKEIDYISLMNMNHFQKCDCILNEKYFNNYCYDDVNTYDEIPKITGKWINLNNINNINESNLNTKEKEKINIPNIRLNNNFDFSKTVLITKNIIDYNSKGVQINLHLKLYEKSTFWIFTRCYVDNYDYLSEEIKKYKTLTSRQRKLNLIDNGENIEKEMKMFSKYSTVIKIFKNKNSNKAFVSFGTFYKNKKNGNLIYKTFLQRQLVDFIHEDNNYYYLENDLCEFDIIILDLGNEYLQAKISLNNKEKYNNIKSNFYLPLNKKAKLMFCGEGNNIKVTKLEIKSFIKYDEDKEKFGIILSEERKECDCCSII